MAKINPIRGAYNIEELNGLAERLPLYVVARGQYNTSLIKPGDDLVADYQARQETHNVIEAVFTDEDEAAEYYEREAADLSAAYNFAGSGCYEVLTLERWEECAAEPLRLEVSAVEE